ncbi:PD-(D/E)XK nuclease family protein [Microbacterium gorillae]|uniref:PD-(D/E)XK nuclease family protein n=1 Tax=Microbacterium gorillae TaxID=1231063 RepID=UPI003D971AB5
MAQPDFHLPDAAWSGGHLLLADEAAVAKVRRKWFSASVASKTLQCPASMAATRLIGQIEDPFGNRELGTARHAVMEDFYTLPGGQRTLAAMDVIIADHAATEWSIDKLDRQDKQSLAANNNLRQRWVDEVTVGSRAIFNVEDPTRVNVHKNEWKIFTHLGKGPGDPNGVPSILKIDRVVIGEDGGHEVDDFKFKDGDEEAAKKALSKPNPRYGDDYGDQQRLYVAGIEAETGVRPKRASLIYPLLAGKYRGAMNGVRNIDISEPEIRKTLIAYKHAYDLMNASADRQKFETRPSALCSWCLLVNSCPVAAVGFSPSRDPLKRQASIDKQLAAASGQPSALQLGIPTLRPGAAPAEARTGAAPGVTVPKQPQNIEPDGDDLFPVTLGDLKTSQEGQEHVQDAPTAVEPAPTPAEVSEAATTAPEAFDPFADVPWPDEPSLNEPIPFGLPSARDFEPPRMWETAQSTAPTEQTTRAEPMDQNMSVRAEGPVYDESVNGALNLNSYAAMAVSGLVGEAYAHLASNGQVVSTTSLSRFADVLAGIVLRAQFELTGQVNFQRGAQTRLRGLLRTHLEHRPAPFGQPAAVWEQWLAGAQRFLVIGLTEAMNLYDRTPVQNDSHLYFATDVGAN